MDTMFRIQYLTEKTLLNLLGPADLEDHNDPIRRLERKRDERLGARPVKHVKPYVPKRHFAEAGRRAS